MTESKLLSNLIRNDKSNRSLVFISHRLSLAEKVDKVIFVKNSKVIEVDEHLKLMKRNKPYRELIYANNK